MHDIYDDTKSKSILNIMSHYQKIKLATDI